MKRNVCVLLQEGRAAVSMSVNVNFTYKDYGLSNNQPNRGITDTSYEW